MLLKILARSRRSNLSLDELLLKTSHCYPRAANTVQNKYGLLNASGSAAHQIQLNCVRFLSTKNYLNPDNNDRNEKKYNWKNAYTYGGVISFIGLFCCGTAFCASSSTVESHAEFELVDEKREGDSTVPLWTNICSDNCNIRPGVLASEKKSQFTPAIQKSLNIVQQALLLHGIPGISVCVSVDGEVVFQAAHGYSDVENDVKCSVESVYRIASISKPITAVLAMKYYEQGLLDLDDPVSNFVKEWPEKHVSEHKTPITVRHLLSHTSGIRHYHLLKPEKKRKADKEEYKKARKQVRSPTYDDTVLSDKHKKLKHVVSEEFLTDNLEAIEDLQFSNDPYVLPEFYINRPFQNISTSIKLFMNDDLFFKPGTDFRYTTHGYTLLSLVLERATQSNFEKLCSEHFKNLGFQSTSLENWRQLVKKRARLYQRKRKLTNVPYVDVSYKWAGGGMLSKVKDLDSFGNAMLYAFQTTDHKKVKHGATPGILSSESVHQMWSPMCSASKTKAPKGFEDSVRGYGLGWEVKAPCASMEQPMFGSTNRAVFYHTGSAIGASSILAVAPTDTTLSFEKGQPPSSKLVDSNSGYPKEEVLELDTADCNPDDEVKSNKTTVTEVKKTLSTDQDVDVKKPSDLVYHRLVSNNPCETCNNLNVRPQRGVVVSIICNLSNVNLRPEAFEIVEIFSKFKRVRKAPTLSK